MINNKKLWAAIGTAALIASAAIPALAATEGAVTATVTAQNISITVSDGSVAYGTLAVNTSKDTTSGGLNDTQTATNNGNVIENFLIRGSNSTPSGWVLAGAAGADQYVHQFCKTGTGVPDPCDATPTYTALTTVNQSLTVGVAASGTQRFDLKVTTPTSSSSFAEQNVNVTVVATI